MYFLGWDCANKTLAWTYISIDMHILTKIGIIFDQLRELKKDAFCNLNLLNDISDKLEALEYFLDNFFNIIACDVNDILNKQKVKDVSEINRTKLLHKFLHSDKLPQIDTTTMVLIEHQPMNVVGIANIKSMTVSNQLAYHYAAYDLHYVDPKLKNKIALSNGLSLNDILLPLIDRYKNIQDAKYTARKQHTSRNLTHLLTVFGKLSTVAHIRKPVFDDHADSIMQIFAYCVENKMFSK